MSKHTPGPWLVGEFCEESGWIEIYAPAEDRLSLASVTPANSHLHYGVASRRDEETKSNASLIAAAPDLLMKLTALIGAAEYLQARVVETRGANCMDNLDAAIDEARAAIAKATGK